jgi:hypothetical protein
MRVPLGEAGLAGAEAASGPPRWTQALILHCLIAESFKGTGSTDGLSYG